MRSLLVLLLVTFGLTEICLAAPVVSPAYNDWQTVANADIIVEARLSVPVVQINEQLKSKQYDYVTVHAVVPSYLKGAATKKSLSFVYYPQPDKYQPSPDALVALDGLPAVIFLQHSSDTGTDNLYLAGNSQNSILPTTPFVDQQVRQEIANERDILTEFPNSREGAPDDCQDHVASLIKQILVKRSEIDAFAELEELGTPAVPSIIRLMDDRRPLPMKSIELSNHASDSFESTRLYGPKEIVDALAAILNQITGESFAFIYNGGTEPERRKAVNSWKVYLHYTYASLHTASP
jgi:hypothetical protein